MPARSAPTARQRRIGAELRKMREHAGLTVAQAAERLGTDRTRISNTESGRLGVRGERVHTFAGIYECGNEAYVEALSEMAESRTRGWWEEYRGRVDTGLLDLAELEHHASHLKSLQIMHIPGLLQTEQYARAVFALAVPAHSPVELRRAIAYRMRRREVLDSDAPPQCTFIVHEAALRLQFGDRQVTLAQMDSLLEASTRENLTVRILPFSAGGFPTAGASASYARGPVAQLDTVQLDIPSGVSLVDAESSLVKYRKILDHIEELTFTPEKTRDFIRAATREI